MILLYQQNEIAFDNNGLGALPDTISCTVTEERNGVFEVELQYPITGIHYSDIQPRNILYVKPDPYRDPQPFRIYRVTKPLSGRVTVYAQHISYDLSGIVLSPFEATSAQEAFLEIKANSSTDNPFTFRTDISSDSPLTVSVPSSIRSIMGGQEGSILDTYGGEYEYDMWEVKLLSQRGQNSGVTIRYGKNLTDLNQDENISNVATGVYPYWKGQAEGSEEETVVVLPEKIVNATGTYSFTRIMPLDLSGEFDGPPTEDQLRDRAEQYVKDNDIGVPAVSITVAFQPLEQTEEYKDIALLERVNLCDTVTVEYPDLGVSATAKCVKTVYDALKDKYTSIELGEARTNITDTMLQQQQEYQAELEKVPTTSAMQKAIANATLLITGNSGGYVVIRNSADGTANNPDEILIMEKPDVDTAQKVWRWNLAGLGYSSTGANGPFTTAITQDGSIVATFITSGSMNAGIVTTGILKSQDGQTYINLDSGQFQFKDYLKLIGNDLYIGGRLYSTQYDGVYAEIGDIENKASFSVKNSSGESILDVYDGVDSIFGGTMWQSTRDNIEGQEKGIIFKKRSIGVLGRFGGYLNGLSINTSDKTVQLMSSGGSVDISGGDGVDIHSMKGVTINGTSFDDLVNRVESLENGRQ